MENNYRFRELRESTETNAKRMLTALELSAEFKNRGHYINRNRIAALETKCNVIPNREDLEAYCQYFNTTSDYLLGIRDTKPVDENIAMINRVTGLSDKSIQILKEWNELKKKPIDTIAGYGSTDIDALNLLLEDCYYRSKNAGDFPADWSIFHHIYNYFFSEHLKKHPHNTVKYKHTFESINGIRSELKKGDVIISDGVERTVEKIETYNERGFESTSDNFSMYNEKNQNEVYKINFQKIMESYTKDNILKILERIRKRIKERT